MSFDRPQAPAPMILPQAPPPAQQMLQPTAVKPGRKASQPTMIGQALTPTGGQEGGRSLIGAAGGQ